MTMTMAENPAHNSQLPIVSIIFSLSRIPKKQTARTVKDKSRGMPKEPRRRGKGLAHSVVLLPGCRRINLVMTTNQY
jgi:hypothetical protein